VTKTTDVSDCPLWELYRDTDTGAEKKGVGAINNRQVDSIDFQ
jgi:hypothetical protein